MNQPVVATTREETPFYFPAGQETLFGIFTRPTVTSNGTAVIVLSGGGSLTSSNRNRLSVRLCRRLAAEGFHAVRFDYHGVGESTGVIEDLRLDQPFTADLQGVVRWLQGQGLNKFLVVGSCFGARTALTCVPSISGLQGIVLASPPIGDMKIGERHSARLARELSTWGYVKKGMRLRRIRQLFNRRRRRAFVKLIKVKWTAKRSKSTARKPDDDGNSVNPMSTHFLESFTSLVDGGVPTLLVYGDEDDFYEDFERARDGRLGKLLRRGAAHIEIVTISGEVHGFTRIEAQEQVLHLTLNWVCRHERDGSLL